MGILRNGQITPKNVTHPYYKGTIWGVVAEKIEKKKFKGHSPGKKSQNRVLYFLCPPPDHKWSTLRTMYIFSLNNLV